MTSLTDHEIRTIYKTILRAEQVRDDDIRELADLFSDNPRLIITPNDKCAGSCLHCVADSTPLGATMSYDDFAGINPEFLEIFSVADFGRRGNPLLYRSGGHDLVDLMKLLHERGVTGFTLALALQTRPLPVISRLEEFSQGDDAHIETMVTYHHYHPGLDRTKLAQEFNSTLINYLGFSRRIIISLLGDRYSQQGPTKAEDVQRTFQENWNIIFADIGMTPSDEAHCYHAQNGTNEAEIKIPRMDTRVYPLGRFRKYLSQSGILQRYEEKFEQVMSDYACPDLVKWPGIIIEPDGGLNLCASFEAIACRGAIVTNIFSKSYEQVRDDLMRFHQKELNWFIDHLPYIIAGKVSTCKLKNNCYQQ
jgi:hypothetical protein